MSFARDAKLQILQIPLEETENKLAFFSGLLSVSGEYDPTHKTMSFLTDLNQIYEFCNKILVSLYGDYAELEIEDDLRINKTLYYRITLPRSKTFEMLKDFGLVDIDNSPKKLDISEVCKDEASKKSFIKGVFIACATSGIRLSQKQTEMTSCGYDVEFVARSHSFLLELSNLLAEFNITPKLISRKNHFVLYTKESSQVCDLLALVEAYDSVLKLQNELALRELRNKVNRQTNCMSANISKTVDASFKQMQAIELISDTIGLEQLPFELQEVALLRLANPEESLKDLLKLSNLPLTKSGLNHRISKILKIAKDLE